jgi:hypothetical protein
MIGSVKSELIKKSREAALTAVQIFNNPNMNFKSEAFIVLMLIAWTYLFHAYYREKGIDYRYFKQKSKNKVYETTAYGAHKYWDLVKCINEKNTPIDSDTKNNLRFLIGLRHEIEHQMTTRIDDTLSARFQACCLNYNHYLKELFGKKHGIEKHLSFSIQFSSIGEEQKNLLSEQKNLPLNIRSYIEQFDESLSNPEFSSPRFAYRLLFVPKLVNRKGQADHVFEFVKSDSPLAEAINKEYAVLKEVEKQKYLPSQIIKMMHKEGFPKFGMHHHTELWRMYDAKNVKNGFGTNVADKTWHYYDIWVKKVREHCQESGDKYK